MLQPALVSGKVFELRWKADCFNLNRGWLFKKCSKLLVSPPTYRRIENERRMCISEELFLYLETDTKYKVDASFGVSSCRHIEINGIYKSGAIEMV